MSLFLANLSFFLTFEWVSERLVHVTKLHVIEQVLEIIANLANSFRRKIAR